MIAFPHYLVYLNVSYKTNFSISVGLVTCSGVFLNIAGIKIIRMIFVTVDRLKNQGKMHVRGGRSSGTSTTLSRFSCIQLNLLTT